MRATARRRSHMPAGRPRRRMVDSGPSDLEKHKWSRAARSRGLSGRGGDEFCAAANDGVYSPVVCVAQCQPCAAAVRFRPLPWQHWLRIVAKIAGFPCTEDMVAGCSGWAPVGLRHVSRCCGQFTLSRQVQARFHSIGTHRTTTLEPFEPQSNTTPSRT